MENDYIFMENDKELREKFSKVLGIVNSTQATLNGAPPFWEAIFVEIGRLQERASRPMQPIYPINPQPSLAGQSEVPHHYHNGPRCYKNPCYGG